jgi:predicted house-cleaning noncanonical NTP pyrophosphatase (MazG superfamily)
MTQSYLEQLPNELQNKIMEHLSDEEVLALAEANTGPRMDANATAELRQRIEEQCQAAEAELAILMQRIQGIMQFSADFQ